MHCQLP
ncbi:hypothetical protein E2C01_076100 [Portunus trituberculatus]|nr:hypothetical protein [Portunus trituberculatus]